MADQNYPTYLRLVESSSGPSSVLGEGYFWVKGTTGATGPTGSTGASRAVFTDNLGNECYVNQKVGELKDSLIVNPVTGDVFVYDATNELWINTNNTDVVCDIIDNTSLGEIDSKNSKFLFKESAELFYTTAEEIVCGVFNDFFSPTGATGITGTTGTVFLTKESGQLISQEIYLDHIKNVNTSGATGCQVFTYVDGIWQNSDITKLNVTLLPSSVDGSEPAGLDVGDLWIDKGMTGLDGSGNSGTLKIKFM